MMANRERRSIAPMTTAELVEMARKDESWYGDE